MKKEIKNIDIIYGIFRHNEIFCKICIYHILDIDNKTYKEYGNDHLIFIAIKYSNYEVVKFLLEMGMNPNIRNVNCRDNRTALMETILSCRYHKMCKITKLLLKYGADKMLTDKEGKTALDYAIKYMSGKIMYKLLS